MSPRAMTCASSAIRFKIFSRFSMSLLMLANVGKRFANNVEALSGLSFSVGQGEFVSLPGPSGCGKSTALRLIAGLIAPDSGTIDWTTGRPEMGFVFQEST